MIVLESNQNHATVKDTEVCPALPAAMGMGGLRPDDRNAKKVLQHRSTRYGDMPHSGGRGGEGGNNLPMILDTLVFDESQITCPTNGLHPQWGGNATVSREKPDGR